MKICCICAMVHASMNVGGILVYVCVRVSVCVCVRVCVRVYVSVCVCE